MLHIFSAFPSGYYRQSIWNATLECNFCSLWEKEKLILMPFEIFGERLQPLSRMMWCVCVCVRRFSKLNFSTLNCTDPHRSLKEMLNLIDPFVNTHTNTHTHTHIMYIFTHKYKLIQAPKSKHAQSYYARQWCAWHGLMALRMQLIHSHIKTAKTF